MLRNTQTPATGERLNVDDPQRLLPAANLRRSNLPQVEDRPDP
jgi:hypothetical protein